MTARAVEYCSTGHMPILALRFLLDCSWTRHQYKNDPKSSSGWESSSWAAAIVGVAYLLASGSPAVGRENLGTLHQHSNSLTRFLSLRAIAGWHQSLHRCGPNRLVLLKEITMGKRKLRNQFELNCRHCIPALVLLPYDHNYGITDRFVPSSSSYA